MMSKSVRKITSTPPANDPMLRRKIMRADNTNNLHGWRERYFGEPRNSVMCAVSAQDVE